MNYRIVENCEVLVFPLSSRAPSLARKQYSQLIRHRKQTLAYSSQISSLIKRRFISIHLLLLCLCLVSIHIVQGKKMETICLIKNRSVRGEEPICTLFHSMFSGKPDVPMYCTSSCLQLHYFTLIQNKLFEGQPRCSWEHSNISGRGELIQIWVKFTIAEQKNPHCF